MAGIRRDGEQVEPQVAAFLGNRVGDVHPIVGFLGTVRRLEHVSGIAEGDADIAVGQVRNVLGGVEVGDVRANGQQLGFGLFVVFGIFAAWVHAHVVEDRRVHFIGRVHHRHAALAEFFQVLGFEQHRPRIDVINSQHLLDLVDVVADAVGAPQVRHRVRVTRVVLLQQH
ncbi:hypothetical protein D3C78_1171390 [compost metagenome]